MSLYPYKLYCERIDTGRNMARYYMLSIQPTLFGEAAVVRSWGRIGKSGREMSELFETEQQSACASSNLPDANAERAPGRQQPADKAPVLAASPKL